MLLIAREGREEGANNPHTSLCPNAMAVVIVHGVERASPYLMNASIVEFFDRPFAFQAIASFIVVLLPKVHLEPRFKYAVGKGDTHTVLLVKEPQAVPLIAVGVSLGADDIFE
jgi:hypothetical protein